MSLQNTIKMFKGTLAGQTIRQMTIRLSVVIGISTLAAAYHISTVVDERMTETLYHYINERGARENSAFTMADSNHQMMSKAFLIAYARLTQNPQEIERAYTKLVKKFPDQAYRNADPQFNGLTETGIFVGPEAPQSLEFKKKILASVEVINQFGLPSHTTFQDSYFTFPENAIAIFWPEDPTWVFKAKNDFKLHEEIYHKIATPNMNPSRKTVWTNIFYDKVSASWMLTVSTPIYDHDSYLGSVHHDVMISEIVKHTLDDHLDSATNFLVSEKGELIAHPNYMKEIMAHDGVLSIADLKDPGLIEAWQYLQKQQGTRGTFKIGSIRDGAILGYLKISGPGWYFVSQYPKSLIWKAALGNAQVVFYAGLISLVIELILIYLVLLNKVRKPLTTLIDTTQKVADGDYNVTIPKVADNEIGDLALAFQKMTTAIKQRDQKIEDHATNLEKIVKERTDELEQQRIIALNASKMSMLGEMAGGVAHEINTPLNVIKILCENSIESLEEKNPDLAEIYQSLKKIDITTDRVAKIIKSLLIFSRNGAVDKFATYPVSSLVDDTLQLCGEKLKLHSVQVTTELKPENLSVDCRFVQLSQVMLNLISNSFDAIRDLPTRWIHISAALENETVIIRVTDSGAGIPSAVADKIFNPFFTTKEIGKGTGMGLSISIGIVTDHGGTLEFNHQAANTEFCIRLPQNQNFRTALK